MKHPNLIITGLMVLLAFSLFLNFLQGDRIDELTSDVITLRHSQEQMFSTIASLQSQISECYGQN